MAKIMFVNRNAPHGTIYAWEGLEVVLIFGAFDNELGAIYMDDAVFSLKKGQDTKELGQKNFSPTYRALEGYDIEKLYVEKESLDARGLTEEDLLVDVQVMSSAELSALMDEQDVVISF
jgi:tRNA 2-thiouridine synthesizing protein C